MNVENKVIVITGGGNGIGRELELALLRKGARVAALDINALSLNETFEIAGDLKSKLSIPTIDITNETDVFSITKTIIDIHDYIDGIINCAGIIQPFVDVADIDFNVIRKLINVNIYGTLFMVKAFIDHLKERPEAFIVNISSMGGIIPVYGQTLYGATKAAIKIFTEGLSLELRKTNIHIMVVFPGGVNTNIIKNSGG
jgi:short-subunit dehydrogenase